MSYVPGGAASVGDGTVTTTKLGGDVTPYGKALLSAADAAAQRTALGLGTAATAATGAFEAAGAITTHAAVTSGVHGISAFGAQLVDDADAAAARATLGLGTIATQNGSAAAWTTVKQTADDSKTNNTLAASTYLTVALSAATRYTVRGRAYLLVQDAAADARFDLNYSGTWTTIYCMDRRNIAGVAAGTDNQMTRIASALPGSTDVLATVTGLVIVEFELSGLTNASGTLSFRFAQVANSATATLLKAGSYMEYMTV